MPSAGAKEMVEFGIVQDGSSVLRVPTRPYDLPSESAIAQRDVAQLRSVFAKVLDTYPSEKGLGLAAPQIGIGRRVAILRPWGEDEICLLNAKVIHRSEENDVRFEGCLSFFDARGRVQRPLRITVRAQHFDGTFWEREFRYATARLICHEIDHLDGLLYSDRMEPKQQLMHVDEYRKLPSSETNWNYGGTDIQSLR